jgi:acetyltransferase EpsM
MSRSSEWKVIIIGAGGHGSELYSYVQDLTLQGQKIHFAGFVDEQKPPGPWGAAEIVGNFHDLKALLSQRPDALFSYITAVGENRIRKKFVQTVDSLGVQNLVVWTLLHPRATVGRDVEIGEGTCLAPGSVITTRVKMGKHCILNVNASVSHDCMVGDFVNINPGAVVCGNVRIGEGCYIGAGATIIDKVSLGAWTVIGAGAVVIEDIPPLVTAVGVPAKVIKRFDVPTF